MIPQEILAGLAKLSDSYIIEKGVAPALLSQAEESLGFRLPEDVRLFSIEIGAIHHPSDSFSILFPSASLTEGQGESAYRFTLDCRKNLNLPLQTLVLDGKDHPLICLDASDSDQGVFTWYDGRIDTKVAPNFFAYLAQWIDVRRNENGS